MDPVLVTRALVIAGYFLVVVLIGYFSRSKSGESAQSFFLADRGLGTFVLVVTIAATNFSAFTVFGASGAGYRDGFAFFPIMAFVATGFEHCVANMYFIPAGIFAAHGTAAGLNWGTALANIGAATLGNIVGGGFFVATFYWFIYVKDSKEN